MFYSYAIKFRFIGRWPYSNLIRFRMCKCLLYIYIYIWGVV